MSAGTVYVAGTCDTKGAELAFVAERLQRRGVPVCVVDLSTSGRSDGGDVTAAAVAARHPDGAGAVFTGDRGGAVAAIEAGWVQDQIEESAFRWQREVEQGERVIVGVNRFTTDKPEHVELHRLDPAIERAQRERTQALRARRDATAVEAAVADVRRVAGSDENLLPALRAALAARATVGELCGALRELWGTYDAR